MNEQLFTVRVRVIVRGPMGEAVNMVQIVKDLQIPHFFAEVRNA